MLGRRNTRDVAISTEISLAEHLRSEREFHGRIERAIEGQNTTATRMHGENQKAIADIAGELRKDVKELHGRVTAIVWKIVAWQGAIIAFLAGLGVLIAPHWLGK